MPRYSHKRPPAAHTASIQFDAGGVSDRKPTAAKSAGTLGKWGVTSFTSIRSSIVNGSTHDGTSSDARAGRSPAAPPADPFSFESNTPGGAPVRKVKKFFKSRNAPPATGTAATDARRQLPMTRPVPQPPAPPPAALHDDKDELESKRFFSSPALPQPLRDTTTNRANSLSPREPPAAPQAPRMPPLKLRISRDKDTGDLTAVSGSPPEGSGGGGARRRRPPAAPAPPQPTKAARYKSPPPPRVVSPDPPSPAADPAPPAVTGDEDEIGGRPVRRTRRAAAVEARQKVAKSVYVEEEDEELVALPVRGRRGQKRRPSSGDLSSAPAPAVPATAPATVPELEPVAEDATSVSDPAPPAVESPVSGAEVPPNGVESPEAEVPPSEPSPPPPPTPPSPPSPPPTQPTAGETRRQGVTTKPSAAPSPTKMPVLTPAPTLVQHPAPAGTTLASTAAAAVASTAPAAVESTRPEVPAPPVAGYQPPPAAPQPEVRQTRSSSQPTTQPTTQLPNPAPSSAAAPAAPAAPLPAISDQGSEPVNLSTRQPAADLERELSNLFGETPTPAPVAAPAAPAAEEPTSRVYRKGIKDLGRYQRTQETRASPAAPVVSGPNSPQPYKDLERQLELMESGRAAPASVSTPASVIGSDSGVGGSSQESESVPSLARASTEPLLAPSGRSSVPTTAAAATTEKAAPSEPKKGSIFKTRAGQGRAARARYNHRWTDDKDEAAPPAAAAPAQSNDAPSAASALDFTDDPPPPSGPSGSLNSRLTRVSTWHGADPNSSQQPVTSVRVDRNAKEYYTVIKNVKKAYQIQEFGEFQEYNDDIDYIMDALQPTNSLSTRCLSATRLAGKCMVPAFRMHLRAHGTVTRFFAALSDAPSDPCLSLCTSAVMFILSEDQLNMDLDKSSLELMLSLLDSDVTASDSDESNAELRKNRAKVRELCAQLQRQGQAKQLRLDNITAGHLSMETLLSLTSQRAGAWFKEELRELGGLDRLLGTISESCANLRLPQRLRHQRDCIARISRCLRVVENVTSRNEENQQYLLRAAGGEAVASLGQLFQMAETELADCSPSEFQPADGAARILLEMTDTLMKVLVNLSSVSAVSRGPTVRSGGGAGRQSAGGALLGAQPGLLDTLLHAVLRLPEQLPEQKQFDVLLLAMYLLMNLAEGGTENRERIATAEAPACTGQGAFASPAGSALSELLQMFYRLVRLATEVETHTDRILDGTVPAEPPATTAAGQQDAGEVTATALIQKAGHHMEKTVIAAYIGVLVGHLVMDNPEREAAVRAQLNGNKFADVIEVLRKLLSFMDLTNTGRPETAHEMRTMKRVIDFMVKADEAAGGGGGGGAPGPVGTPSGSAGGGGPSGYSGGSFNYEELGVLDMSL